MKRLIAVGIMALTLSGCAANAVSAVGSALMAVGNPTSNDQPTYHLVCDDATPSHCHNE